MSIEKLVVRSALKCSYVASHNWHILQCMRRKAKRKGRNNTSPREQCEHASSLKIFSRLLHNCWERNWVVLVVWYQAHTSTRRMRESERGQASIRDSFWLITLPVWCIPIQLLRRRTNIHFFLFAPHTFLWEAIFHLSSYGIRTKNRFWTRHLLPYI